MQRSDPWGNVTQENNSEENKKIPSSTIFKGGGGGIYTELKTTPVCGRAQNVPMESVMEHYTAIMHNKFMDYKHVEMFM